MKSVAKVQLGTGQQQREFLKARKCEGCGEKRLVQRAMASGYILSVHKNTGAFRLNVQPDSKLCRHCFEAFVPQGQTNIFQELK